MNTIKFMIVSMLLAFTLAGVCETADAQARHKKRVVKTKQSTVVVHRPHHKVVVRRAHVHYAGLPRWGTRVTVFPSAAVVVKAHRHSYHFHNGVYYTQRSGGYVVVRPIPGVRIRVLPVGYRTVVVGPTNYYYYYGTFYSKADTSEEYIVTDAPEGAVIDALPDGYEIKSVGDSEYYVLDGVYYAEVDAPEFEDGVGYEVVVL